MIAGKPAAGVETELPAAAAQQPPSMREFLEMPREFAWAYQLVDGRVLRIPRIIPVPVRIFVRQGREANREIGRIRRPEPDDSAALAQLYREAFAGTRGYFGWTASEVEEDALRSIEGFFQGERGEPDPSSRIAVTSESVAGAALVVRHREVPTLFLLFVSPARRRQGIAGALVGELLRALDARGEPFLRSAFDAGDAAAAAWYRAFGFVEEPSLPLAQARVAWLRGEVERGAHRGKEAVYREELLRLAETIRDLVERAQTQGPAGLQPDLAVWQRRWWPERLRRQ